jgi:hypothetical protein
VRAEVMRDPGAGMPDPATVLRGSEVFGPSRLTDDAIEGTGALEVTCVFALEGGELRIGPRVLVRCAR